MSLPTLEQATVDVIQLAGEFIKRRDIHSRLSHNAHLYTVAAVDRAERERDCAYDALKNYLAQASTTE